MAFNVGFNFRLTQAGPTGFAGDPTNYTYVLSTDTSATTRTPNGQSTGVTWQWVIVAGGSIGGRDRSATEIAQCAGINYTSNSIGVGAFMDWNLTLPAAGQYTVGLGMGDQASVQNQYFGLYDGTGTSTLLTSVSNVSTTADHFMDIAGNVYATGATWLSSQVVNTYTFATTTLKLRIGSGIATGLNNSTVASVSVAAVVSATSQAYEPSLASSPGVTGPY